MVLSLQHADKRLLLTQVILLVSFFAQDDAFIVPGMSPTDYTSGQPVPVLAVKLTSIHTQMPFEYSDIRFCLPPGGNIVYATETLGEVLRGDRIVTTPYELIMNVNQSCKVVCEKTWDATETDKVIKRIHLDHRVHMLVDNLPVATPIILSDGSVRHEIGYALGLYSDNATIINNHLSFTAKYHTEDGKTFRVVGLEVRPKSACIYASSTCMRGQILEPGKENLVLFTYDVQWHRSDVRWASRWDSYLTVNNAQFHWLGILNSLVVVLFLLGKVSIGINRLLSSNIAECHKDQKDVEQALDKSGWKPVDGDVLRRPSLLVVLAVLLGTGLQLNSMAVLLSFLAMSGKPPETSRGSRFFNQAVLLYILWGLSGGYVAGRVYKELKGTNWKRAGLMTSLVYPQVLLGTYCIRNFFTWDRHSSREAAFTTMNTVFFLWLGVSMPLTFIGYFFAHRRQEKALDESGWKLVHGDVLRPPSHPLLLAALLGTGLQLVAVAFILLFLAMLGMLSEAFRGSLLTPAVLLYVLMGLFGGYFAGRMYKTLKGTNWKLAAFVTSLAYPSVLLGMCFIPNCFWSWHSSRMVPFTTMIAVLFLWLGVSMPLTFIGYFFGYRKQPYTHPVRTNPIPRQVPGKVWYLHPIPATILAGLIPIEVMSFELFFVISALWQNQVYSLFGFLFLAYVMGVILCSQISIVMVYHQLSAQDYHWWWRSFFVSGGCSFYFFAFCLYYFFKKLTIIGFIPSLLYVGYSILMAFTFWILTGTVGFFAAYLFVRKIYGAIKVATLL